MDTSTAKNFLSSAASGAWNKIKEILNGIKGFASKIKEKISGTTEEWKKKKEDFGKNEEKSEFALTDDQKKSLYGKSDVKLMPIPENATDDQKKDVMIMNTAYLTAAFDSASSSASKTGFDRESVKSLVNDMGEYHNKLKELDKSDPDFDETVAKLKEDYPEDVVKLYDKVSASIEAYENSKTEAVNKSGEDGSDYASVLKKNYQLAYAAGDISEDQFSEYLADKKTSLLSLSSDQYVGDTAIMEDDKVLTDNTVNPDYVDNMTIDTYESTELDDTTDNKTEDKSKDAPQDGDASKESSKAESSDEASTPAGDDEESEGSSGKTDDDLSQLVNEELGISISKEDYAKLASLCQNVSLTKVMTNEDLYKSYLESVQCVDSPEILPADADPKDGAYKLKTTADVVKAEEARTDFVKEMCTRSGLDADTADKFTQTLDKVFKEKMDIDLSGISDPTSTSKNYDAKTKIAKDVSQWMAQPCNKFSQYKLVFDLACEGTKKWMTQEKQAGDIVSDDLNDPEKQQGYTV